MDGALPAALRIGARGGGPAGRHCGCLAFLVSPRPTLSLPPPASTSRPEDRLPTEFGQDMAAKSNKSTLKILVIGESSARGEPFQPWLSVGQILGWQFGKIFARRRVEVDMQAAPGATLEQMHQKLAELKYRPDLLILFSGHNEYQSRYSWIRYVTYYDFERESRPQAGLIETALNHSPFCALVLETLDKQRINIRPPLYITRKLVDWPTCTPEENTQLLIDFRKRLEAIANYCERLGTAAVFIAPASNDSGFDPSRSVLPSSTSLEEQEGFTRDFLDARSVAAADPVRGMERLKTIVAAWPGFAEAHYRLAQLYERNQQWDDARRHYVLAREQDAMPMRCPEAFRDAYRELAAKHPSLILVDSSKVLTALTRHGILGNREFLDAQHPSLLSYVALSQDASIRSPPVSSSIGRRAFGPPGSISKSVPCISASTGKSGRRSASGRPPSTRPQPTYVTTPLSVSPRRLCMSRPRQRSLAGFHPRKRVCLVSERDRTSKS